jgi:hypothetical protein
MLHTGLVLKSSLKSPRVSGIVQSPIRSKKNPHTIRELRSGDGVMIGRLFAAAKWSQPVREQNKWPIFGTQTPCFARSVTFEPQRLEENL